MNSRNAMLIMNSFTVILSNVLKRILQSVLTYSNKYNQIVVNVTSTCRFMPKLWQKSIFWRNAIMDKTFYYPVQKPICFFFFFSNKKSFESVMCISSGMLTIFSSWFYYGIIFLALRADVAFFNKSGMI